jgi:nucleoid DNA-binding protein
MAERIETKAFIHQLALRMQTDDKVASAWLEATVETLYDTFKAGKGVTLPGLGDFMFSPEARHGRSSLTLVRNYGRYSGGHRLIKVRCKPLLSQTTMGKRVAVHADGTSGGSGHMYNQAGVDALDAVRAVVASFGSPLLFRKLYGILNAMEMHVEETPYSVEALQHLGKALEATARLYRIDQQQTTKLTKALATFLRTAAKP